MTGRNSMVSRNRTTARHRAIGLRRRDFVVLAGAALALRPRAARAQADMPVIGMLGSATAGQWTQRLRAFREGLKETGFDEGRNVTIDYRWAAGRYDRLPALAADFVARRVAVIVVLGNTASALAAKSATATIPIVFRVAANPVELGLVASLSRPGGNLTGVTTLGVDVGPKQLELLRELLPKATEVGLLVNTSNTRLAEILLRKMPTAARRLALKLRVVSASADHDLEPAFANLAERKTSGLVIGADAFFNSRNERLARLAIRHAMPAISPYREFALAGGLASYGGNVAHASRQAGVYTGRILKGEKPFHLPVQTVTKLELIINLKTAKALRITVPQSILLLADEVIE